MNKKIITLLLILLLTGCYDRHELNNVSILTSTQINKVDNNYEVSTEIINPKQDKTTKKEIYSATGKTLDEAYRQIYEKSKKYLYSDHIQVMIINENIAKENITQILDFFLRKPTVRTEFKVLIGNKLSSNTLKELKINNKYLGTNNIVSFNDLASMILNPNTEIVLPSTNNNLAVFKDNKLQGYLTKEESITYNIIKNNIKSSIITYKCNKDNYMSVEILKSKTKIIPKNNKINIKINIDVSINETNCNISKKEINNYLNKYIKNNLNNIRTKYNSDIFGFKDEIYKHDYKNYKKLTNSWFKDIDINLNNKTNIISSGNIKENNYEKN